MSKLTKKYNHGGGGNAKNYSNYTKFVALGLSTLLPSFALSSESNEALTQLLSAAPTSPNKTKNQTLGSYSRVADLRTASPLTQKIQELSSQDYDEINLGIATTSDALFSRHTFTQNTKIIASPDYDGTEWQSTLRWWNNITVADDATLYYQLTPRQAFRSTYDALITRLYNLTYNFRGGNIVFDVDVGDTIYGSGTHSGLIYVSRDVKANFDSNIYISYKNSGSQAKESGLGVISLGHISGGGSYHNQWGANVTFTKNLGIYVDKNFTNSFNSGSFGNLITVNANAIYAGQTRSAIYINAKEDGSVYNQDNIIQIENASLYLDPTTYHPNNDSGMMMYVNFSNQSSYLIGDVIFHPRATGGDTSTISGGSISFSNGATWRGNAIFNFSDQKDGLSITLDNATWTGSVYDLNSSSKNTITLTQSTMTGKINTTSNSRTSYLFDRSSFIGTIQGGTWSSSGTPTYSPGNNGGANTSITFTNTAGQVFGSNDGVVDSSYKGSVTGNFDVSANSSTTISGGNDGSKGFLGGGTNKLTFDFKGNARTTTSDSQKFTIAGGNSSSIYTLNAFQNSGNQALDLSSLNTSDTLYKKLEDAGLKIKAGAKFSNNNNTDNVLQGTLLFTNTNIQVGNNGNALFATKNNIVGSDNDLNGLTLRAMFGNATWVDTNNDGKITQDEITRNVGGSTYKLIASSDTASQNGNNVTDKTSTGDIGTTNDWIKKQIGFIFADGTEQNGYVFGGDTQGYSGIIRGGTGDSKYYFANAGYITRTQINDALGDLVLFNTAFRGDLGVKNTSVAITLDFSNNRNGLRSEANDGNANIVGSSWKSVTFNFTGNTKAVKYAGAVVGDSSKNNTNPNTNGGDNDKAKYTMLNLVKYTQDGTMAGNNGAISVASNTRGERNTKKSFDVALQESGLSGFNKQDANNLSDMKYGQNGDNTDTSNLSTTATILALRGTSLDASNIDFSSYIYDLKFGSNVGEIEGITVQDSKLKGTIDLSENNNTGHAITLIGDSIEGDEAEIKFKATLSNGSASLSSLSYDDSTATHTTPKTLKVSGITKKNFMWKSESFIFTKTNLEGDLWGDGSVSVNLNFTDGRTWKMDESGFSLKGGSNIVVHRKIEKLTQTDPATTPILRIKTATNQGDIQLINTGATLNWHLGDVWDRGSRLGKSFDLRGTSLGVYFGDGNGTPNRLYGVVDSGWFNLTFAKGSALQTTVAGTTKDTNYNITDEALDKDSTYGGTYTSNGYVGNYIAESSGAIRGISSNSGFNITFIGHEAWSANENDISTGNNFGRNSTLALINASKKWETNGSTSGISAGKIGNFFKGTANTSNANIIIEGTSLDWGHEGDDNYNGGIVRRTSQHDKLNFKITFINEGENDGSNKDKTYVGDKYQDLATTRANGTLKDSILKVQESKLVAGLNFHWTNANVTFVGDGSQSLDGGATSNQGNLKILSGGSYSSIYTFRDSDLNAGNGTSSIQKVRGTIAFDLTHKNEDMKIYGTLRNMFDTQGTRLYQTKFADNVTFNTLVFTDNTAESSTALENLKTQGIYFNDSDTFGSTLSAQNYSTYGKIKDVANSSSNLSFGEGSIELNGTNRELIFIGSNSHGFGNTATTETPSTQTEGQATNTAVTKLGDSSGSTLTFIDAGTLKVDNLLNVGGTDSNTQQGKGTINLIGSTRIETQAIANANAGSNPSVIVDKSNTTQTLTLYKAGTTSSGDSASSTASSNPITGEGITINAVFTGNNALAEDNNQTIQTYTNGGSQANRDSGKTGASTYNIGQEGEETIYHILFDYTSSDLTFGTHHAYTGTITGLTSDSVIKFKNAGYIEGEQIANTSATIFLDNTELKSDFRGDSAILDFTNGRSSIGGNILTSDTRTGEANGNVLSRKILTFDLTNNTNTQLNYTHSIQAGYKIAPTYTDNGQSILTFQNAPALTLGDGNGALRGAGNTNPSEFIKSLASDAGFSGIGSAKIEEPTTSTSGPSGFSSSTNKDSYILKGTKLVFQGTNITASNTDKSITENTYELDLSFDTTSDRGSTGLGNTLNQATLSANSITMGEYDGSRPLGLSLSFKDKGSLVGGNETITANGSSTTIDNVLNVKLKNDARFNFSASSSNGLIGTLILSENTQSGSEAQGGALRDSSQTQASDSSLPSLQPTFLLDRSSSLTIGAGAMSFVGNFIQNQNTPSTTPSTPAGAINVAFNGDNKAYGSLLGYGEMTVSVSGDALFSKEEAKTLGYSGRTQSSDLILDASNATSGTITLSHSSGSVEVIGKAYASSGTQSNFTALNLSNYVGNDNNSLTLQGAFNLGSANLNLSGNQFVITDDLFLKSNSGNSITLKDIQVANGESKTLSIGAIGGSGDFRVDLTLTNLDPNLTVELTNTARNGSDHDWGNRGIWNIRGTNIQLTTAFWAENNSNLKKFVFAKGSGTQTTEVSQDDAKSTNLTLSQLTTEDKVNESALSGEIKTSAWDGSGNNVKNVIMKNGEMTFIGKESLAVSEANQKIDGTMGKITFGFYNSILKSGAIILDNTSNGEHHSLGKTATIQDIATLRGTDTFNLSVSKSNGTTGANNSTINAVFVNGENLAKATQQQRDVAAPSTPTILTGNTYIDAENGANEALKTTLSQYATSNAGGALSDSILKTLQSKAYGNIAMDNTVTANMKFIGSDSHSFDGKTIVEGSGESAKVYTYVGSGSIADTTPPYPSQNNTDWKQVSIDDKGLVSYGTSVSNPQASGSTYKYAQLIGGNSKSRFDFDHTSVALDLVKFAGGSTYVYNSSVSGSIGVSASGGVGNSGVTGSSGTLNIDQNSSTTIIFNAQIASSSTATEEQTLASSSAETLSETSLAFINNHFTNDLGINLDLSTAHTLKSENLTATQQVSGGNTGGAGSAGASSMNSDSSTSTTTNVLASTEKQTNLIFIGKGSVDSDVNAGHKNDNTDSSSNQAQSIDISFMPQVSDSSKYSYTFIGAGEFSEEQISASGKNFGDITGIPNDPSGADMTIFGTSKVTLVDTYVFGARNFAQVGFIDTNDSRNQRSSWGGGESIHQTLIFDFHNGVNNQSLNGGKADAIANTSTQSRYIFTSIFSSETADSARVLTLGSGTGLKSAINAKLKENGKARNGVDVIGSQVVGYLGLRGVSIEGDIDESVTTSSSNSQGGSESADSQVTRDAGTSNASGNRVDIVFNSTDNISYIDGFDENGEHTYSIKETGYNKVANIYGINNDKSNISGYAVLKASSSNGGVVTIKGSASKDIVFIGANSVEGGFDKLKIEGGDNYSHYTFHSVGTLSQTFLENVGLYKTSSTSGVQGVSNNAKEATAGTFTFANSTINGDINVDANTTGSSTTPSTPSVNVDTQTNTPSPVSKLIFDNVLYSGTLSGSLEKELVFANGSDNIVIKGGGNASSYDFSNLSKGSSINLSVDLSDSTTTNNGTQQYLSSNLTGFESGDISLTGSLKLARNRNDLSGGNNQTYSNSFAFNDDAKWTMTDSSRVMNLSLSNSGTNYNLDLYSASRSGNAIATQDDVSDNAQSTNKDLRVLEVGSLSGNGGQVLLGTSIDSNNQSNSKSDKIKASVISSGTTLYITAKDSSLNSGSFDTSGENAIVLVSADTSYGEVKGAERKQGLSYVTTALEHQVSANSSDWSKYDEESSEESNSNLSHRWVLSGFDTSTNQELVDESGFIISNPYRMLLIETNNLNKRMGDLRDNDYNHGAWIRVFNGSDSGEGSKNLYTNIQLGYDYGTPSIGAKNYSGVAFSTSIVDIDGNQYSGKANTYSVALYNAYIADSGLYVDTIGKYLYTDQKLSPTGSSDSSFGSHALSLGLEVGYRAYMGESNFYFETQAEAIGGVIFGVKDIAMGNIGGMDITGDLKTTLSLNTRVGIVQGYSLKTQSGFRADFRLGVSLVNESVNDNNSITLYDSITEASTSIANDTKAVLNVGTNLILTDQWRVYLDAERSFGGKRNVDYQANVGARFSFGEITKPLPKPEKPLPLKVGEKE